MKKYKVVFYDTIKSCVKIKISKILLVYSKLYKKTTIFLYKIKL